ncbi:MAG: signal peptidase [Planctomycetes bacterium]|nr:signal peptidase [Planctomycetota bacterium]
MMREATIRYGEMLTIGNFRADVSGLQNGDRCIVRTDRGTEYALCVSTPRECVGRPPGGEVLRRASMTDVVAYTNLVEQNQKQEAVACRQKIEEFKLPMKLVSAEHLFGGEKVVFYFMADGRVDFRELVRSLAREYKTRIEMRQIGARDEARLLGDYGPCGRVLCCKTFIKEFEPVTMRMAKAQISTLDPAKLSGRCGKLKCCLRYEFETYNSLRRDLPRRGTKVRLADGVAEVLNVAALTQEVFVEKANGQRSRVPRETILEVLQEGAPEEKDEEHGE